MPTNDEVVKMISVDEDDLADYLRLEVPDTSLESFFGKDAADVRNAVSVKPADNKKGDSIIILLPGLTGSLLEDVGSNAEAIWVNPIAFLKGRMNDLDLDDDGVNDLKAGVRIEATKPIWLVYAKLLLSLQQDHEVYSFAYDWRRAPGEHAKRLAAFIDEKIANSTRKQVTLVGHSMGGLVILDYLAGDATKAHAEKNVRRAVTLGTPFRGALDAALAMAKADNPKMVIAKKLNNANDAAKLVRSCPGFYSVLPAPNNLYPGWEPLPELDIYNPETWTSAGIPINAKHLATAKARHEMLAKADPQTPIHNIVGVYYATPVKLMGKILTAIPKYIREGLDGGDGTVEAGSATLIGRDSYFVQEVHIELVLEQTIIDGIKDWVDGGQPTKLVRQVTDVVQNDAVLRGTAIGAPKSIAHNKVAGKISNDQGLDSEDIRALFVSKD